ncbi:hypothetical protein [Micromonospora sp. NPDC048830]|uniref:hypothetical protein n=1 Tax=Micromonospora sp. NPDC048830 TaxID=3364257 RepID=UPI003713CCBE
MMTYLGTGRRRGGRALATLASVAAATALAGCGAIDLGGAGTPRRPAAAKA